MVSSEATILAIEAKASAVASFLQTLAGLVAPVATIGTRLRRDELAADLEGWRQALVAGSESLDSVADTPGIRIRWAELYALLRGPIAPVVTYGAEVTSCTTGAGDLAVRYDDKATGSGNSVFRYFCSADGKYV